MALENLPINITQAQEEITQEVIDNIPKIIKPIFSTLLEKFKPLLYIILILIILYIIFKITLFVLERIKEKRIKKTYYNTEKIISKLEEIEKKIESLSEKKKAKQKKKL